MKRTIWYGSLGAVGHGPLGEGAQRRYLSRPLAWVTMGLVVMMMLVGLAACGGSGTGS